MKVPAELRYVDVLPALVDTFQRSSGWKDWTADDFGAARWLQYNIYSVPWRSFELLRALRSYTGDADVRGFRILDLGCGAGTMALWLALDAGSEAVVGVDLRADLSAPTRTVTERLGVRNWDFVQGDLVSVDTGPQQFNLTISWDNLYYPGLPKVMAIRSMYARLRPGGIAVVKVINRAFPPRAILSTSWARHSLTVVPLLGRGTAAATLTSLSIPSAPTSFELARWFSDAGFDDVCIIGRQRPEAKGLARWFMPTVFVAGRRPL